MTRAKPTRQGFTLIELMCVMMLLALLLTVLTLLFRDTLRVERIQSAGFDRILQSKSLADQFRADVASAETEELEWKDYQADEATLILRLKNKAHIVYRWHEGKLVRHVFEDDADDQTTTLPVGGKQVDIEFIHAAKQRVVRLRIHPTRDEKREAGRALEFSAALAGDWR